MTIYTIVHAGRKLRMLGQFYSFLPSKEAEKSSSGQMLIEVKPLLSITDEY